MRSLLLCFLLVGCASTVQVPTNAPVTMEVNWQRVGYFALQSKCAQGGQPYSPLNNIPSSAFGNAHIIGNPGNQILGCAVKRGNVCTIWTTESVHMETLGHEVAHCFGMRH